MPHGYNTPSGSNLPQKLLAVAPQLADQLKTWRDAGVVTPMTPIPGKKLAAVNSLSSDVEVRAIVNFLRQNEKPIGANQNGYFWALTYEELEPTVLSMADREVAIRIARVGMVRAFEEQPTLFQ